MVCPFILVCERRVDFEYYREYCSSVVDEKWRECEEYKRMIAEKKKPVDWMKEWRLPASR